MKDDKQFSLNELSGLVDLPGRTIRYYIQSGLLKKPLGKGRGAHYDSSHVEQLLKIRKWSDAGVSLERIGELLNEKLPEVPVKQTRPGDITVRSHLYIDDGIELMIDPVKAGLSPEQVRTLSRQVMDLYEALQQSSQAQTNNGGHENVDGNDGK